MKLSLHIGTPKTGTTSCQRWFAKNRAELRAQGVIYPQSLGAVNHRSLTVYGQDYGKPDPSFQRRQIKTAGDHSAYREQLRAEFLAEVQEHPTAHHWVISNEHLFSKIKTVAAITRVRDFLAPHFAEITVYLHLRPQVDLLVSGASQQARLGRVVSLKTLTRPAVSDSSAYFNYDQAATRWASVFGLENLRLVPFKKHPSITEYLQNTLGIDRKNTTPVPHINEALGWQTMAMVNGLGTQAAQLGNLTNSLFLNQMPKGERLQIGLSVAQKIQARFTGSNTRLAARHPEITLADLTPDWSRFDTPENASRLNDEATYSEQFAYVITRYRQELRLEQARAALAEAEWMLLSQDEKAQNKFRQLTRALKFQNCLPELVERREELMVQKDGLKDRLQVLTTGGKHDAEL